MRTHASDAAVALQGCNAILNFATSDTGKAASVTAGAPAAIVAAMSDHPGNAAISQSGCWALLNVAASEAGEAAGVAAGAPAAIVAVMRTHRDDEAVARYGCWALLKLASSGVGKAAATTLLPQSSAAGRSLPLPSLTLAGPQPSPQARRPPCPRRCARTLKAARSRLTASASLRAAQPER